MLALQNISFSVGQKVLLQKLNFAFQPGQLAVILGANGAGKSTLMHIISKKLAPTEGEIHWKNKRLESYSDEAFALERAFLTQQTKVAFNFSVEDTVMMGRYPHFKHQPSLDDIEIATAELLQQDLKVLSKRSIQTCSGGEQQRAHIARVWSQSRSKNKHQLLLLDEPLNNLDIRHQHLLLQKAADYANAGNIVIAVLHDINLAATYADQILLLKKGQLLAHGNPAEVLNQHLLSEAYDFPAEVIHHPLTGHPMVVFGQNFPAKNNQAFFPKHSNINI